MENWIWLDLECSSSVEWLVFHHISGLPRFGAFCCHHYLIPDTTPCCKFRPLTYMLANHKKVMLVRVRTIHSLYACSPSPGPELMSAPLVLLQYYYVTTVVVISLER